MDLLIRWMVVNIQHKCFYNTVYVAGSFILRYKISESIIKVKTQYYTSTRKLKTESEKMAVKRVIVRRRDVNGNNG